MKRFSISFASGMIALVMIFVLNPLIPVHAGTLQDMIDDANPGDIVTILPGSYYENIVINKDLTLRGNPDDPSKVVLHPGVGSSESIITVSAKVVTLEGLTITGAAVSEKSGGGVNVTAGSLLINRCVISQNTADYGGGIFVDAADSLLEIQYSQIINNSALNHGGGIFVKGILLIEHSIINSNTAAGHGGGIHSDSSNVQTTLLDDVIQSNTASMNGGGVNLNGHLLIDGGTVIKNNIAQNGGGILKWNAAETVSIYNATFESNLSTLDGGALFSKAPMTIVNSTFTTNTSSRYGGALYAEGRVTASMSNFTGNKTDSGTTTDTAGGGIYAHNGITGVYLNFNANQARCHYCSSTEGGGVAIMNSPSGPSTIYNSTFEANQGWFGGGVFSANGVTLILTDSSFVNNGKDCTACTGYGAGVSAYNLTGTHLTFEGNRTWNSGAGIDAASLTLTDSRFIGNQARSDCGGLNVNTSFTGANLLFVGNIAQSGPTEVTGGSALCINASSAVLSHATIVGPSSPADSAVKVKANAALILKNSILAFNDTAIEVLGSLTEDYNLFYSNAANYSLASGGGWPGTHSLTTATLPFANSALGDYHLRAESAAIGLGINLGVNSDLDGRSRIGRWDAGAYQYYALIYLPLIKR